MTAVLNLYKFNFKFNHKTKLHPINIVAMWLMDIDMEIQLILTKM